MLDCMKEINKVAKDLGLITEFSLGTKSKEVEITIISFELPNKNSKRVEKNQPIGPITLEIKNNTFKPQALTLYLTAEQQRGPKKEKPLYQEEINLNSEETKMVNVGAFQFSDEDFCYGESVHILAKAINKDSGSQICQVSRTIWFGIDEPSQEVDQFVVTAYEPLFPRTKSRRVELTESIHNLRFKISNNTALDIKINVDLLARKAKSPSADVQDLKGLKREQYVLLPSMSEKKFSEEVLNISNEDFGWIDEEPADPDERKCEIFFSTRFAESIPPLNKIKGDKIDKKTIPFFLGIDPEGDSIFKKTDEWEGPKDGRRSRYEGNRSSGYIFLLNVKHPSYLLSEAWGDDAKQYYIKEQMLRQAYIIAVSYEEFHGVLEKFKDALKTGSESPPEDHFRAMEELIGEALIKL